MIMEKRIAKLERQYWWYRNLFILAGLMAVALVTWGATKPIPDVIRARSIQVVNGDGKTVTQLGFTNGGHGAIWIYRRGGITEENVAFYIHGKDSGATLNIYSKGGNAVGLAATNTGGGNVSVFNRTGEQVVQLYPDDFGNGVVGAYNRKGNGRELKPGP